MNTTRAIFRGSKSVAAAAGKESFSMQIVPSRQGPRIWGTLDPFVENGDILGRRVANSTFLEAFLAADPFDAYHFFLPDEKSRDFLTAWTEERFPDLVRREAVRIRLGFQLQEALASTRYHCMHLADPVSHARLAQLRNACSGALFPITGITHSLSYAMFMPEFLEHLWAGVCRRDAVIASSESARLLLERYFAGLRQGYGLDERSFPAPRLVRIPLGVDAGALPTAK